ncbi:patatin-like phospholipase family protein [Variovorax sp.]|uniref:patatin-like phospholipase family protein n=1 Tax=Variovorax sp. TaxID=1871043 RepID=UPI002D641CFE|nr:patatin-like phospholipase family protein [Variovorax sp.]HYP82024.1 patatin-like phospholipase family protein [Variovorax sp.]
MIRDLSGVDVLAFSGGGNRCFWQAGVMARLLEKGMALPATLIGTSAGAAIAASCMTIGPEAALDTCMRLFAKNRRMFHWPAIARMKLHFAHQQTYPDWIASIVNTDTFPDLQQAKRKLLVAVSRSAMLLGKHVSIAAATLAYIVDKKIVHSIHPRLPRYLGLQQQFYELQQCTSVQAAQALLNASAAAPPLTRPVLLDGRWALDGGYVDNAPLPRLRAEEQVRTLVLLTRHYPRRPEFFCQHGRVYWQPSQRIPVSTWDCTIKSTVQDAFNLGYADARRCLGATAN